MLTYLRTTMAHAACRLPCLRVAAGGGVRACARSPEIYLAFHCVKHFVAADEEREGGITGRTSSSTPGLGGGGAGGEDAKPGMRWCVLHEFQVRTAL